MTGVVFWALVGLATVTGLATAWTLRANSNSPPFAPAIGANAIPTMRAAFLVGILAALGSVAPSCTFHSRGNYVLPRNRRS